MLTAVFSLNDRHPGALTATQRGLPEQSTVVCLAFRPRTATSGGRHHKIPTCSTHTKGPQTCTTLQKHQSQFYEDPNHALLNNNTGVV